MRWRPHSRPAARLGVRARSARDPSALCAWPHALPSDLEPRNRGFILTSRREGPGGHLAGADRRSSYGVIYTSASEEVAAWGPGPPAASVTIVVPGRVLRPHGGGGQGHDP